MGRVVMGASEDAASPREYLHRIAVAWIASFLHKAKWTRLGPRI